MNGDGRRTSDGTRPMVTSSAIATTALIDPDAFTKTFKKLAAQAGLDPRTALHNLRHAVLI